MHDSPVVDKGKAFGSTTDQRGLPRPDDNTVLPNATGGDGSDIGAFEVQFRVAGTLTIGGRVMFAGMVARSRGTVTLTDSTQSVHFAPVNPAGYYRFAGVPLGRAYTVGLISKGWSVEPQMIFVADPITDLALTAKRED